MDLITNVLYRISTGLLVPVIVLLILFFIRALVMAAASFGQYMRMKKSSGRLYDALEREAPKSVETFRALLPASPGSLLEKYASRMAESTDHAGVELLLSEYELAADKSIATSRTLAKMGPILGLMGTLIPMGPALTGLATGDIAAMAGNMQVAFATTVVGLTVSAIGYLTQQTREHWASADLAVLEYLADLITEGEEGDRS